MEMNLLIFAERTKDIKDLAIAIEQNKYQKMREIICVNFPSVDIQVANNSIILEIADTILSIVEEEPKYRIEYLKSIRESIQSLKQRYHTKKEEAARIKQQLIKKYGKDYTILTSKERNELTYTPEIIKIILEQLDAKDNYISYTNGHEYDKYQIYNWLIKQINETLEGKTHERKNLTRSVIDDKAIQQENIK